MSSDLRFTLRRALLWSCLAAAAPACADFSRGEPAVDAGGSADASAPPDGGALSYATDIAPLLKVCTTCHVPGGAASSTALLFTGDATTDHATVLKLVQPAAPASSRLLAKASGNGHGGGTIYAAGTTPYATILAWIQQGAPP